MRTKLLRKFCLFTLLVFSLMPIFDFSGIQAEAFASKRPRNIGSSESGKTASSSVELFNSTFDDEATGENPAGWIVAGVTTASKVAIVNDPTPQKPGNNIIVLTDGNNASPDEYSGPVLKRIFSPQSGIFGVEASFKFAKTKTETNSMEIAFSQGDSLAFRVYIASADGTITFDNTTASDSFGIPGKSQIIPNSWYKIKFVVDVATRKVDIQVSNDNFKTYTGTVTNQGNLDKTKGVFAATGLSFSSAFTGNAINTLVIKNQRYEGLYSFDNIKGEVNPIPIKALGVAAGGVGAKILAPIVPDPLPRLIPNIINIKVNNEIAYLVVKPTYINERIMVPFREMFELLGAEVEWDNSTKTAKGMKGDTKVSLTIDKDQATVNGKTQILDVPAMIINNRTFVPLRFVTESLGGKVEWDAAKQTASITIK